MTSSMAGTKELVQQYRERTSGGSSLAGKYRIIAELGQGGMATVYLAAVVGSAGFRRLAVLKVLRPEIAEDADFVQMFLDEAKLCARLAHPNIVHTYDVGGDELGHLIAMEYLDGVSMHAAVSRVGRDKGPFSFPLQARVLLDVLDGLRYAHELCDFDGTPLHIVHRDVTPHNIFITYEGQVKLLDFGIAKATTSSVKTATGVVKGKLTYMAPEQARCDPVDARADLYAVGVMLWEAVTGRRRLPSGLTEPAMFVRIVSGDPPESPNAASFGYPAEIDAIVLKALAPRPEERFQTAAEFRDALEQVLRKLPPLSLRDLGSLLGETFAVNRRKIRTVIEEQFRLIDSGEAAPHLSRIPSVHPPHATGSESRSFEQQVVVPTPRRDSGQVTMTATNLTVVMRAQRRRRVLAVSAGVLAVAGAVAIAYLRWGASPTSRESVSSRPTESVAAAVTSALPALGTGMAVPPSTAMSNATSPNSAEAALSADPSRRGGPHGRPNSGTRAPGPSSGGTGREASGSNEASPEAPKDGVVPLRKLDGKPKVQLERENPWP